MFILKTIIFWYLEISYSILIILIIRLPYKQCDISEWCVINWV